MHYRFKNLIKELIWYFHNTNLKSVLAYILFKLGIPIKIYKNNNKQKFKIIIIGCGTHAISTIIPIILKKHSIKKIFIKKLDKYHLIKKIYNIEVTDNLESVSDNLHAADKVFILSPPETHIEYLKYFIKYDINIFVEKPLVTNKKQLLELRKLYKENNFAKVIVGYNRDYSPAYDYAKEILNNNYKYLEITYRINFGKKNKIEQNRTIEHVCHYLSFIINLIDSKIIDHSIFTSNNGNSSVISGKFENESIFSIIFSSEGRRDHDVKENIFISFNNNNLNILDFKKIRINKNIINFNNDIFGYNKIINNFLNNKYQSNFYKNILISEITINES